MTVCVIPARGGSKRIPRKNIKNFFGKPIIAWSIEAAQKAKIFSKIIVSTDDKEIASISESLGADIPFMRPNEIADDYSTTVDVMAHACSWMKENGFSSSIACCLYPTAPFIYPNDLKKALNLIESSNWKYVFSVAKHPSSIFRSFTENSSGGVKMLFSEMYSTRSQDLPSAYCDAGMFYMGTTKAWIEKFKVFDEYSCPMKIPSNRVQDIDTSEDWERAEYMAKSILVKKE